MFNACAQEPKRVMIPYSDLLKQTVPDADARIPYGTDPLQFGELRLPAGTNGKVPLIVLIHGGCWQANYNLDHTRGAAVALTKEGYAIWTPEYRRLGDTGGGWPGTFDDIAHAVDYVRELAKTYPQLDTTRVIAMGHSAGGHLALWSATRTDASALKLKGVVSLAGIADVGAYAAMTGSCAASAGTLMGGIASDQAERYAAGDPIRRLPIPVRTYMVHGEKDPIVPLTQSESFVTKNQAAGGKSELATVPSAGHFDVVAPWSDAWPFVLTAVRSLVGQ